MAKAPNLRPYVRLRQREGDPALYVTTTNGWQISGRLDRVAWTVTHDGPPYLQLELLHSEHGPLDEDRDTTMLEVSVGEIFMADVIALDFDRMPAGQELEQLLTLYRTSLLLGDLPPCEHEEIIDTTGLDDALAQGMCVWCGCRMVAEQHLEITRGPWKPARD